MKQYIKQNTEIELTQKMMAQLQNYADFLVSENEKYNLTTITENAEIWEKHFADSILGCTCIAKNATVCDIGTGAGFPAIPLKIARPDICITLVDSLEKRINFCKQLCAQNGIEAEFVHARAEDFAHTHAEQYDVCVARAVAPLNILLEYTATVLKMGGILVAYKTDLSEVEASKNACQTLGVTFVEGKTFTLPSGANRCLLVFKKVAHTPNKYPRGQNKPRKNPL